MCTHSECWARAESTSSIQIECTYLHWLHFYVSAIRVSSSSVSPLFARTLVCHWVRLAARRLSIAVVAVSISKSFAFILLITSIIIISIIFPFHSFHLDSASVLLHVRLCIASRCSSSDSRKKKKERDCLNRVSVGKWICNLNRLVASFRTRLITQT